MSSDHSKLWKTKKSLLGKKESRLQDELESVSSAFEGQAKKILIGVAIVGVAAIAVGIAINSSKKKKAGSEDKKKDKPQKVVAKSSVKNVLLERITTTVLSIILSQLGNFLKSSTEKTKS